MYNVIGTCGFCGGQVTIPGIWGGVIPPIPSCANCGREVASHGPVMPMKNKQDGLTDWITDGWYDL